MQGSKGWASRVSGAGEVGHRQHDAPGGGGDGGGGCTPTTRRGCVTPMSPSPDSPASSRICAIWVVFPLPVSPITTVTGCSRTESAICLAYWRMGSFKGSAMRRVQDGRALAQRACPAGGLARQWRRRRHAAAAAAAAAAGRSGRAYAARSSTSAARRTAIGKPRHVLRCSKATAKLSSQTCLRGVRPVQCRNGAEGDAKSSDRRRALAPKSLQSFEWQRCLNGGKCGS